MCKLLTLVCFVLSILVSDVIAYIGQDGRVLVFDEINMVPMTICDDRWNDKSATVMCRQSGMGDTGVAITMLRDYIYYSKEMSFSCTGTESDINDCLKFDEPCSSKLDAVADCYYTSKGNFALVF